MNSIFDKSTFAVEIVHVFGGSEEPWVCMEAVVSAKTLEGEFVSFQLFLFSFFSFVRKTESWAGDNILHSFVHVSPVLACLHVSLGDRSKESRKYYLVH